MSQASKRVPDSAEKTVRIFAERKNHWRRHGPASDVQATCAV